MNWQERIHKASLQFIDKYGPGLLQPSILHDDWCFHLEGRTCNCTPDIVIVEFSSQNQYVVDKDGNLIDKAEQN